MRIFLAVLALITPSAVSGQQDDIELFKEGKTNTFTSVGHPKADGLELTFRIPAGWGAKDGNHPHIVVNVFDYKRATNCSLLIVNSKTKISRSETLKALSPTGLKGIAPEGAIVRFTKYTAIDGLPAGELIYDVRQESAGIPVAVRALVFMTIYSPYVVQMTCTVADIGKSVDRAEWFKAYLSVFHLIANSIIIQNQWKLP